jgi:hypothetical protein
VSVCEHPKKDLAINGYLLLEHVPQKKPFFNLATYSSQEWSSGKTDPKNLFFDEMLFHNFFFF